MTPQVILRIAGIAALVVALLFAILAIHYFLTNDIRGVMDDLSGKARAKGVAGARGRAVSEGLRSAQARRRTEPATKSLAVTKGTIEEAPSQQLEAPQMLEAAPAFIDEDDMGTVVVDANFGAPAAIAYAAAEPDGDAPAGTVAFHVTRTIILCDSDKIIAAG